MQLHPLVAFQPFFDIGMFVCRVIIDDDVEVQFGCDVWFV